MFHRQSVCGLILGLTLVILAGVFRPAEGTAPLPATRSPSEQTLENPENAGATESVSANSTVEGTETPGQTTGRGMAEAPGKLP